MIFHRDYVNYYPEVDSGSGSVNAQTAVSGAGDAEGVPSGTTFTDAEEKIRKLEQDINRMKSSFQRRENELKQTYESTIQKLQEQLELLEKKVIGEDEALKQDYEKSRLQKELEQLRQERDSIRQRLETVSVAEQWKRYFAEEFGLPLSAFEGLDEPSEILQTGFTHLKQKVTAPQQTAPSITPSNKNPTPVTAQSQQRVGTTLSELVKKYGSEEKVFSLAEEGYLDLTKVIPD